MTRDEAFATYKDAAVDVLSVDADKVVLEASFADDLDADSLDLVEFVMALEDKFGVEIPESDLEGVKTVGQAFEIVCTKLSI
jgi:acyl carrier protein